MLQNIKVALRSLGRAKGLSVTVVLTLALGIGANAAIFSVVRGVLLRPLSNRDEAHLIYVRQSAQGLGAENTTFSVPEIQDLRERAKTLTSFGEFSTISFTMVGLGEPRQVRAGVVDGHYFEVMGLSPVLGRLLNGSDDGPNAQGAAVLTYRFWTTGLKSDPTVLGKNIRLGTRTATIVGVLQPSDPYPAETELIANVVTSPHHLSATMVTGREHRMTEVFGRLAPGATVEQARTELRGIHSAIMKEHPEAYASKADFRIDAMPLRDQITSRARTVLLVLLAASGLVFVIAVSNVANLILARTVRRESELAVRAALGASTRALRGTLLAESLVLCGTGAALGVAAAPAMFSVLSRYASRFSVRALDLTLDSSALWVGVALALTASVLLAYIPRLPNSDASNGLGLTSSGLRVTGATNRRLRIFAVIQIAASFVLLAGAGMLLKTLLTLQATQPGFETSSVLAVNVPVISYGRSQDQIRTFYRTLQERVAALPGVEHVALGSNTPWRDAGGGSGFAFSVEGKQNANPQDDPRARIRTASPGFFATLGIPIVAGRDFNEADRNGAERVVIINQRIATQLFPGQDPINRHLMWTDGIMKFIGVSTDPRRIVGVAADVDDERITPSPQMMVYSPFDQELGSRLFVRMHNDPYSIVSAISNTAHELSPDQPVERAATLEDIRSEVMAPERLNTIVFGGFAAVALAISIVGVAGVLAFSVSARTREFGVRLAIGSQPRRLLSGILLEGFVMATIGVATGYLCGLALSRVAGSYVLPVQLPGVVPIAGAALILVAAATIASLLPAMRAARVDVMEALRSD
jgi:putative ABC transport system permease protein